MLRKNEGHFNGWVAYTFSRSLRTFDQINNGSEFPDKYDCPNNFSLFVSGKINDHWTASASWVYATGNALTLPVSRYLIADNLVSIYSNINSLRMPAYHRADVGVTRSTQYKYFTLNFNFSVYNVYDHANPMYVYVLALCEGKGNNISVNPVVVSLMPVLPCFGIELKF